MASYSHYVRLTITDGEKWIISFINSDDGNRWFSGFIKQRKTVNVVTKVKIKIKAVNLINKGIK